MGQVWIVFRAMLTSFSLSDILVDGCVFLPPVMDLTAPILYHILECGFESTNLQGEKKQMPHTTSMMHYQYITLPTWSQQRARTRGRLGSE